nr:nonaspanin [Tanacetum cinerariifolium]
IDGTHIGACILEAELIPYIGKKGIPTLNVMMVCDFDLCFTFISVGWDGLAHETCVFLHAINNPSMNFPKPPVGQVIPKKETLVEVLNGVRLTNNVYELRFREDKVEQVLCNKKLKIDDIKKFRDAIMNFFYFQMYYDDLPFRGFIGKMEDESWTVLLTGLLILLFMRHLKNDLKKYPSGDEEQDKEVGWKYVHSDVFRYPPQMALFCAVLGTGTQLLIM